MCKCAFNEIMLNKIFAFYLRVLFVFVVKNQVTVSPCETDCACSTEQTFNFKLQLFKFGSSWLIQGEKMMLIQFLFFIFLFFYFEKSYMALKAYPTGAHRKSEHKVSRWGKSF